ncbi:hypothetical protein PENSPDRAFT_672666 [Peniophora sp. CONT]|nr:hypothetical protein PENSPDRAFT_672666 [Peniophora sp. CONT]
MSVKDVVANRAKRLVVCRAWVEPAQGTIWHKVDKPCALLKLLGAPECTVRQREHVNSACNMPLLPGLRVLDAASMELSPGGEIPFLCQKLQHLTIQLPSLRSGRTLVNSINDAVFRASRISSLAVVASYLTCPKQSAWCFLLAGNKRGVRDCAARAVTHAVTVRCMRLW